MKILSDIYNGKLVNEEASGKMLDILKGQTVKHKIPAGLPSGYISANKTGEMPEGYGLGCIENDTAIIWPPVGDPYILVVLSNDLGGRNDEAQEIIRQISSFVATQLEG
jgi:beta-lactamase class A